jgi:hypothetical protein
MARCISPEDGKKASEIENSVFTRFENIDQKL